MSRMNGEVPIDRRMAGAWFRDVPEEEEEDEDEEERHHEDDEDDDEDEGYSE